MANLWDRWLKNRRRPHSPGLWVIYFALATLPLFGIGQWAIANSDTAARRSAFHCLLVYVASAMALLGTTSFLGIRRYLRQRKLEMPTEMALTWAVGAGGIVLAILLVASFLPRPRPAYSLTEAIGSRDLDRSSRYAVLKEDGADSEDGDQHDSESSVQSDRITKEKSERKAASDEGERSTSDGDSEQKKNGDNQGRGESGKPSQEDSSPSNESPGDQQNSDPSEDNSSDPSRSRNDENRNEQRGDSDEQDDKSRGNSDREDSDEYNRESKREGADKPSQSSQLAEKVAKLPQKLMEQLGGGLSGLLKLLYWLVIVLAVLWFCYRFAGPILAAIRGFLADLSALFGGKKVVENKDDDSSATEKLPERKPFAAFSDPTSSGKSMTDRDLVRYTFLALEAWAHEHGCTRGIDETPFEFAKRLAKKFPKMGAPASYLVQLYDRMAYASSTPQMARDRISMLWQCMRG